MNTAPPDVLRQSTTPAQKPVLVAIIILIVAGFAYRTLQAYYTGPSESKRLPPGTLARLPLELGDWQGEEQPLDQWTIEASDTDQILSRRYIRRDRGAAVSVLVFYGIRLRDLLPHRPEVCYTTHGWTLRRTDSMRLNTANGVAVPCQSQKFDRAGMGTESLRVLNYYLVDGQYGEDVSLLRSKVWKKDAASHYMAQVQIVVAIDPLAPDRAMAAADDFARVSAPAIRAVLESAAATP